MNWDDWVMVEELQTLRPPAGVPPRPADLQLAYELTPRLIAEVCRLREVLIGARDAGVGPTTDDYGVRVPGVHECYYCNRQEGSAETIEHDRAEACGIAQRALAGISDEE